GNVAGVLIADPGTGGNVVQGNLIGTNAAGTAALGNTSSGVEILTGTTGNTIGGSATRARNGISGNQGVGLEILNLGRSDNVVAGNFIGTDVTGTVALANRSAGVLVGAQAKNNTIGGNTNAARNVISGNQSTGVQITDSGTSGNTVAGNFIGI